MSIQYLDTTEYTDAVDLIASVSSTIATADRDYKFNVLIGKTKLEFKYEYDRKQLYQMIFDNIKKIGSNVYTPGYVYIPITLGDLPNLIYVPKETDPIDDKKTDSKYIN